MKQKTYDKKLKQFHELLMANNASAVHNLYDKNHLDCFWYNGANIVTISYKSYDICFDVCGDISISLQVAGKEDVHFRHRGGSKPFFDDDEVRVQIPRDEELNYFIKNYNIVFENNNWINVVILDTETNEYISEPYVASSSNVLQAAIEEFEHCKKYIDAYEENLRNTEPENNVNKESPIHEIKDHISVITLYKHYIDHEGFIRTIKFKAREAAKTYTVIPSSFEPSKYLTEKVIKKEDLDCKLITKPAWSSIITANPDASVLVKMELPDLIEQIKFETKKVLQMMEMEKQWTSFLTK